MTAPMQNLSSNSAVAGTSLAATGAAAGVAHLLWLAAVLFVVGGTLIALAKLGPRVAVEPVRRADGHYRPTLTVNGRPIRRGRRS
jgi:hypothetical protein